MFVVGSKGVGSLLDFALRQIISRTRSDRFSPTATITEVEAAQSQATTPRFRRWLHHPEPDDQIKR